MIFHHPGKEWGVGKLTFSLARQEICC